MTDRFEIGEVGDRVAAQCLAIRPLGRAAGRNGGRAVDTDAHQLALGLGDLLRGLAEQSQRRVPRDQPAQVGHEAAVQVEAE